MRSRRQAAAEAVSVLGMDPWKDDRVRDFVAINTIQRLRTYHLPAGAPMPDVEEVNTARALNLLLISRAEPDYRPCCGEQPPSRALLRARRRAKAKRERHEQGAPLVADAAAGAPSSSRSASASTSASSVSGDEKSEAEVGADDEEGDGRHRAAGDRDCTTPQLHGQPPQSKDTAPMPSAPLEHGALQPDSTDAEAVMSAAPQCAVDRARAVFFGAASFTSSTSPRRLVNSPHVPLTPSATPASSIAARSATHIPRSPTSNAQSPTAAAPPLTHERSEKADDGVATASTARSLAEELDAHIAADSTPLRPPPPLRDVNSTPSATAGPSTAAGAGAAAGAVEGGVSPDTAHRAAPSPPPPLPLSGALDATPSAVRPPSPRSGGGSDGEPAHSCEVCDAIAQYYQSLLNRGVVLDRYNHKDLAFAWWVLGRNMDTAALDVQGPMRREALIITLRNFYYTLLSAEEAKATASAGRDGSAGPPRPVAADAPGVAVMAAGNEEDAESRPKRGSGKAIPMPPDATAHAGADPVDSAAAPAAVAVAPATPGEGSASGPSAVKRPRPATPPSSPASEGEGGAEEGVDMEQVDEADTVDEPAPALPPPPTATAARRRATAPAGVGLAAALRKGTAAVSATAPSTAAEASADAEDGAPSPQASEAASLASSTTASRAGSVAPGSGGEGRRRHRLAAERDRAVEEMWTSTRTGRRTAAIKAAAQLELQVGSDATGQRRAAATAEAPAVAAAAAANPTNVNTAVDAPPKDPEGAAAGARGPRPTTSQRKRGGAAKRGRSPSPSAAPADGDGAPADADANRTGGPAAVTAEAAEKEEEGQQGAEELHTAETRAPGPAAKKERSHEKSTVGKAAKAPVKPASPPTAMAAAASLPPPSAAPAKAAAVTKQGPAKKNGEEHRGRPRGSFKVPRVAPPSADVAAAETPATPPPSSAVTARSGQRRGDPATTSAAAAAAAPSAAAAASLDTASNPPDAPQSVSNLATSAAAPTPPPSSTPPSSAAAARGAEAAGRLPSPPTFELPLRLTPHERAVRARIQQRMGAPLEVGSAAAAGSAPASLYSSYTFLLSSFPAAVAQAATAPVMWYGPAVPPAAEATDPANAPAHGGIPARTAKDKGAGGVAPAEEGHATSRPASLASAIAAAVPARQRGRKRKIEGGIDPSLRSNVLRHDQAALERRVRARLAQASQPTPTSTAPPPVPSSATTRLVKKEPRSGSESDGDEKASVGMNTTKFAMTGTAAAAHSNSGPHSSTASSPVAASPHTPVSFVRTAEEAAKSSGEVDGEVQLTASPHPRHPAAQLHELPYAQQCLLVWSAAGLLESDARQRQAAEMRRARLLARCGRMATRRMAARVAAAAGSGRPGAEGGVEGDASEEDGEHEGSSDAEPAGRRGRRRTRAPRGEGRGAEERGDSAESPASSPSPASSRSSSASSSTSASASSSTASSGERTRRAMRPLPRRVYDYWSAYRTASL